MALWRRYRIICKVCEKEIIKSNKQETCSIECRNILRKRRIEESAEVAECQCCGKKEKLLYYIKGIKVCSARCKSVLFARFYRKPNEWFVEYGKRIKLPLEKAVCIECGKEYKPKRYDQKYCSKKCLDRFRNNKESPRTRKRIEKLDEARNVFNKNIGKCELCGTDHNMIATMNDLGIIHKPGKAKFHKDHIIPKANGGNNIKDNTRYVCWFCNFSRRDLDPKYDEGIAAAGKAFWEKINEIKRSK